MPFTAAEIAERVEGELVGDGSVELTGFAPADLAQSGHLTFAENEEFFAKAAASQAAAILVQGDFTSDSKTLIRVKNARVASARILPLFFPEKSFAPGVHPTAVIAESATVDPTAHIGPHSVVCENVRIAAGAVLESGVHVDDNCVIGENTRLFPRATIYRNAIIGARVRIHAGSVIGSDGFGYVFDAGAHQKIPQIGNVIIGDDVEIGANVAIDRGALGPTIIGKGSKIDNLVQIAHNVEVGEHSIVVSQVGIAGSTKMGKYVTLAGQAGLAGHLKIGNQVTVMARSGVMTDIPDGEVWLGAPARPNRQMKRMFIAMEKLPDLSKRIGKLEKAQKANES